MFKIYCWNVNGVRSLQNAIGDLENTFKRWEADVVCFQETRVHEAAVPHDVKHVPGYQSFWSYCSTKKGYSGVATYCRASMGVLGVNTYEDDDREGRIIALDLGHVVLFNCYFPNAGSDGQRLDYKSTFFDRMVGYTKQLLDEGREVIIVGDVNVAYTPLDICQE